jgi:hypothetical protein
MNLPLKVRVTLLSSCLVSFEPEKKCLPVNAKNNLQGHERIFETEAKEVWVAQGNPLSAQEANQFTLLAPVIID